MSYDQGSSDVLYYPFSRCINIPTLKQMLLVFESIAFCDPVDDETWRGKLFEGLESEDLKFRQYRDVNATLPGLFQAGALRIIDPSRIDKIHDRLTSDAILADLEDKSWSATAAAPEKFKLPTQRDSATGKASWNVFQPKLPKPIVDMLRNDPKFGQHLYFDGRDHFAWRLSYAAGSSVGINTHLAVAHEVGLQPVTDSSLHHQLMLMKMRRSTEKLGRKLSHTEEIADLLTRQTALAVIKKWLSQKMLETIEVEQIMRFRADSAHLRRQFFTDARDEIEKHIAGATSRKIDEAIHSVSDMMVKRANDYQNELEALRDKLWPNLVGALGSRKTMLAIGASLSASFILSPAHMLIASIPALVAPAKVLLTWNADNKKVKRKATSSVAFLTAISSKARLAAR